MHSSALQITDKRTFLCITSNKGRSFGQFSKLLTLSLYFPKGFTPFSFFHFDMSNSTKPAKMIQIKPTMNNNTFFYTVPLFISNVQGQSKKLSTPRDSQLVESFYQQWLEIIIFVWRYQSLTSLRRIKILFNSIQWCFINPWREILLLRYWPLLKTYYYYN